MTGFTSESLPLAIKSLFELNNYDVTGPTNIHGAEVDLVARSKADPFAGLIYIEATIEYVDNDKYGKDVGKLAMVRAIDPNAQLLIVSSRGFSAPVSERAAATRIRLLTYEQLFSEFERFDPYLDYVIRSGGRAANDLAALDAIYEEPLFSDSHGEEGAIDFLGQWRTSDDPKRRWLVIVGQYGTGKTALTKVLQYRWLSEYAANPTTPIPFRIELRDFVRQFDARGLIHHFLDMNGLGHLSIDFVFSLIRTGRVVLLLDGYDEMAQYLHARERRVCLEALAQLSSEGAKGILTSRPNYFTEGEELQVFEILYTSLTVGKYHLGATERALVEEEARIDNLLEHFLDRFERTLRDLTQEQTEALIGRVLTSDPVGRDAVTGILRRIFHAGNDGSTTALSGKPVIITYLLEVVEALKASEVVDDMKAELTEWEVYKLIVDLLMVRDLQRTRLIPPNDRRRFLHSLSVILSRKANANLGEADFKDLVAKVFATELRRFGAENRNEELERLFADLRSSATLTRADERDRAGWRFSHNSLREFLLAEYYCIKLTSGEVVPDEVPISDAMRSFVASRSRRDIESLAGQLASLWAQRSSLPGIGRLLSLLWDALVGSAPDNGGSIRPALEALTGTPPALNQIVLSRIVLSTISHRTVLYGTTFAGSELYGVKLDGADLRTADFSRSVLENVSLRSADLRGARFGESFVVDVDLTSARLDDADFASTRHGEISIIVDGGDEDHLLPRRLEGVDALGYLAFNGASVTEVSIGHIMQHHPKYVIVRKVMDELAVQTIHQRRGVEQRGAAAKDVPFARQLVKILLNVGMLSVPSARKDLLEATDAGRAAFKRFEQTRILPDVVIELLRETPPIVRLGG